MTRAASKPARPATPAVGLSFGWTVPASLTQPLQVAKANRVAMSALSREELYELVWSKTMRDAAATIPMSDVGLKKECRRRGVPVPPQGYWNKVRAGHTMQPRPPLPPEAPPPPRDTAFEVRPLPQVVRRGERQVSNASARARSPAKSDPESSEKHKRPQVAFRATSKRKGPRRNKRRLKEAHYVMSIDRWEWVFSFGINNTPKWIAGNYSDYRHLVVHGRLVRPAKVAGTATRLSFVPSDIREAAKRFTVHPTHVGSIWKDHKEQSFKSVVLMPEDILPSLLPMLLAERLRYVVFTGTPLFRGHAEIRSYRFTLIVDFDDMPPDAV